MKWTALALLALTATACSTSITSEMIALRRDLHRHPELSGQEVRTAGVIAAKLRSLGLDVRTNVGGHGVVGILRGTTPGKVIAYRADMDACPGDEPEREVRSLVKGVQHVCGHDVHVAIGVGVASSLAQRRSTMSGTVVFLFQPAEETLQGAKAMIEAGALENPRPEVIYALHTFPLQVGEMAYSPGHGFAGADRWTIKAQSEEHVGRVLKAVNALNNASFPATPEALGEFLRELEQDPSPMQNSVFVNADVRGSTVEVYVKASDDSRYAELREHIRRELAGYELKFGEIFPRMASDRDESNRAAETLHQVLGAANVRRYNATIPYVGEDFALFLRRVPGAMFYLGVANRDLGIAGVPHMPDFDVDERAIEVGIKAMTAVIDERLSSP